MTETAIDRIAAAGEAAGGRVQWHGRDKFRTSGLCHDGDSPDTVSVRQLGGRAKVKCFKGCDDTVFLERVRLRVPDLFDDPIGGTTWERRGRDGSLLFTNTRRPAPRGKGGRAPFRRQNNPDAPKGALPVPYGLPDDPARVRSVDTVYVVEGESDVDAAHAAGVAAVTAGNADSARACDWSPLYGLGRVVIVHDNDEPGLQYAADVRAALTGHVGRIDVARAATGKDLSDHLAADLGVEALVPVDAESLPPSKIAPAEQPARMRLQRASAVRTVRQRWLWADRIPMDTPSIFAGRGGEGKTTYALHLAAQLTRGLLPGEHEGQPAGVLIWSGEDRAETVLVPRLQAAGADLDRVHIVESVERAEDESGAPRFPDDVPALEAAIRDTGAVLAILDPLTSTTAGDLHKVADVRATLDPLAAVTRATGAVVLGIMHFNKGQGHAGDKLSGSHAFRDAVRSLFLFATDEESGHRVVTQEKNNYAENVAASLAFALDSTPVLTHDDETVHVARVVELGESDVSVQDIISRGSEDEDQRIDRNEAQAWLLDYLTDRPDREAPSGDVIKAAAKDGFSAQQIKDARRRCRNPRIVSQKAAFTGGWVWSLDYSEGGDPRPQGGEGGEDSSPRPGRHLHATLPPGADKVAKVAAQHQDRPPSPPSPPSSESLPPSCIACGSPAAGDGHCDRCRDVLIPAPKRMPGSAEFLAANPAILAAGRQAGAVVDALDLGGAS